MGATKDLIQGNEGAYEIPRVRVWIHPHKMGETGSDYPQEWQATDIDDPDEVDIDAIAEDLIAEAREFKYGHPGAEDTVLVAYDGYEFTPESFRQYRANGDEFPEAA